MTFPKLKKSNLNRFSAVDNHSYKSFRKRSWVTSEDLFSSFKYALQGLDYAFKTQRNFRIHIFTGFLVVLLSSVLNLSATHTAILVIAIAAVMALELINTSIESVVDLIIDKNYHPLARIAKDSSAASVLVVSISAFIIAILILVPPILGIFF